MLTDAIDLYFSNIARNASFETAWKRMTSEGCTFEDCVNVFKFAGIGNFFGEERFIPLRHTWAYHVQFIISESGTSSHLVEYFCQKLSPEKQQYMLHELSELTKNADQDWLDRFHASVIEYSAITQHPTPKIPLAGDF